MNSSHRAVVGHYLQNEHVKNKYIAANSKIEIIEKFSEVTNLQQTGQKWIISTTENQLNDADYVFLCLGHLPSDNFKYLIGSPNYIHSAWDIDKLSKIPCDANTKVHIIGGHLTMIDAAKFLTISRDFHGQLISVTRNQSTMTLRQELRKQESNNNCNNYQSSLNKLTAEFNKAETGTMNFQTAQSLFWNTATIGKNLQNLATKEVLNYQLNDSAETNDNFNHELRNHIDFYQDFITDFYVFGCYDAMWKALSKEAQQEFKQLLYSHIVAWVAGIPTINARFLIEMYNSHRIEELSGLQHIEYDTSNEEFILHFNNNTIEKAKYIINATGTGSNIGALPKDHLISKLAASNLIEISQYGFVVKESHPTLIAIGPKPVGNKPGLYASFLACYDMQNALKQLPEFSKVDQNPNLSCFS